MIKIVSLKCYFVLFFLTACNNHVENIKIINVSQSQQVDVNFKIEGRGNVEKIELNIEGFINDTAKVGRYFILPGKVDTTFRGDWYSTEYKVDYNPFKADSGRLVLDLEFIVI